MMLIIRNVIKNNGRGIEFIYLQPSINRF